MINGVELIVLDQFEQMRKLKRENSIRLKENLKAFHKIIQIWDLGQDVVPCDQVRPTAFCGEFFCHLHAEETDKRRHPFLYRHLGDVCGWFNTQYGNIHADEILQQVSVVAGHLSDKAMFV